jgi:hypothetical protein
MEEVYLLLEIYIYQGLGIFLFTTASRAALRPTQPPIQWIPGALSPPFNAEVKNAWRYTSTPPIRRHGTAVKEAQKQLYNRNAHKF